MIGNNQALNALRVGYVDKRKYIYVALMMATAHRSHARLQLTR